MTEDQLHRAVADYLAVALPSRGCVWTTFPAGGGGKARGAQLKARGLRKGWPDVQILWRAPGAEHGRLLCIELKTEAGRADTDQLACHGDIYRAGGLVLICRSVREVEDWLRAIGIPLCATVFGKGVAKVAA